ncbi:MAG: methyltransferase domain-containing protein [bacterium]|nr:methyltransferase domain-containing protein [bacterium]
MKKLLHIGPAKKKGKSYLGPGFQGDEWQEIRLDVDPAVFPDILENMTDMKSIQDNSIDAIFTSHTIEHLYPDDVKIAMEECLRVLKPDGFLVMSCPDLQSIGNHLAEGRLLDKLYESEEGPITPIDIIYGYRGILSVRRDRRESMSHRTGFTLPVMIRSLEAVGFPSVIGKRRPSSYEMWVVASKGYLDGEVLKTLASGQIPD